MRLTRQARLELLENTVMMLIENLVLMAHQPGCALTRRKGMK
jgi:hypothetical protein